MFWNSMRTLVSLALPTALLKRSGALRGTKFLARAALKARFGKGEVFTLVSVGACDGMLFDDVTPWLKRIPGSRAMLVEPVPYNQARLRANYPDEHRFRIEPVAVTRERGTITVHTFDSAALERGELPMEFIGCSSVTDTNLVSGKNAWGAEDPNFAKFQRYFADINVPSERLQTLLDRNGVHRIDAFLVDCEGADWIVFEQLDLERYRPGMIKIEIGALGAEDIGRTILKLKTAGYDVELYAEDVWAFA